MGNVHPPRRIAVYLHVPFCRARCSYCDFNTYAGLETWIPAYVAAVAREIATTRARWGPLSASTLYFGGGTPSLLPHERLAELLGCLRAAFIIAPDAEISLEANPTSLSMENLRALRALGINRLSLGVQSANADELHVLGRAHTWEQAVECVALARTAGFDNLNLDLIYGLPGQMVAHWRETLEAALALQPEHLSLYALSVEAGTPLEARIARGTLPAPDADVAAEMYEVAEARLAQAGFFHYEISNWARAGGEHPSSGTWWPAGAGEASSSETVSPFVCRHNLAYWRSASYLGFGAGAASWWEGRRWCNVRHPAEYVMRVEHGRPAAADVEGIEPRLAMGERMMMGLRLAEGVRNASFRAHFGVSLEEVFGEELARLRELGLLGWDGQVARLTPRGRLLGNRVFQEFLPD